MVRRLFILVVLCFLTALGGRECVAAEQQLDSATAAAISEKLQEYFAALERESVQVKCEESDFIIATCSDSLIRQAVAIAVYDHFFNSPVMGDDAVAIHIFDKWMADGPVRMNSEADWWNANFFASTNRESLIGCKAPELDLLTPEGLPVRLFGDGVDSGGAGIPTILYFYDTGCVKCKITSILMQRLLESGKYKVRLCAVYVGFDKEKWEANRKSDFDIDTPEVEVVHLWDPDMTSGMSMKYGVVQTPRLFLVSPEGTVIGRGLDADALEQLLDATLRRGSLEYGSDETMEVFRRTFAPVEETMDCGEVARVAGHIESRTLAAGDTLMYKQLVGDLLYFLTSQRGEAYKCGTGEFLDGYILSRNDVWNTAEDTLMVVDLAALMKRLGNLCPVGGKLPKLKVPAQVLKAGYDSPRKKRVKLSALKNAVVIFHTEGCSICEREISQAGDLVSSKGSIPASVKADGRTVRPKTAVLVDMDEIWNSEPALSSEIMGSFDLSALPFELVVDGRGKVCRKYISLLDKSI